MAAHRSNPDCAHGDEHIAWIIKRYSSGNCMCFFEAVYGTFVPLWEPSSTVQLTCFCWCIIIYICTRIKQEMKKCVCVPQLWGFWAKWLSYCIIQHCIFSMKSKQTAEVGCINSVAFSLLFSSLIHCGLWLTSSLVLGGDFTSHTIEPTPIQLFGGSYIFCSQTGREEIWKEKQKGRWGDCLCFGSIPNMYFGGRRACWEIRVEAEIVGRFS